MSEKTSSTRKRGALSDMRPGAWINLTPRVVTARPTRTRLAADGERPQPPAPERRLYAEILATAVNDLLTSTAGRSVTTRKEIEAQRAAALAWISGAPASVSFAAACEVLGFDVELTRRALLDRADPSRAAVLFEIGVARSAA